MAAKKHNFLVGFKTNSLVVNLNKLFKFLNDLTLSFTRAIGKPIAQNDWFSNSSSEA